jgi:hypothetical protein
MCLAISCSLPIATIRPLAIAIALDEGFCESPV